MRKRVRIRAMSKSRRYSEGTRAALAALSQGTCYYPGCDAKLVIVREDGEAFIEYEIAHIFDANPGNRFNPKMSDEERRSFANLILLCKSHHEEVDKRKPKNFPASTLLTWKRGKESTLIPELDEINMIPEEQLAASLASAAIRISNSIVNLGGQGGQAPGAGGGGGGAIGPNAVGGKGGDGGEIIVLEKLPVEAGQVLEFDIGAGGLPGQPGEDTIIRKVNADGSKTELLRARGGGRKGFDPKSVPFELTGTLLANSAEIHNGLASILSGGWDNFSMSQIPSWMSVAVVLTLEPSTSERSGSDISVFLKNPTGKEQCSAKLWVESDSPDRPLRLLRIFYFNYLINETGIWTFEVRCNQEIIGIVPFRVALVNS